MKIVKLYKQLKGANYSFAYSYSDQNGGDDGNFAIFFSNETLWIAHNKLLTIEVIILHRCIQILNTV